MSNTTTRTEDAVEKARESVSSGAEKSREKAADVLERLGGRLREQSARAGRITETAGDRLGSKLERRADWLRPRRSPFKRVAGYAATHPFRALMLVGLLTGVVALIALPVLANRRDSQFDAYL
ncbi:MAG TPA: hypothetical protein VGR43_07435 [Dehalococcoidia bacterium]|jgi:hypothetical protein|nr:hypothetical protein [Dehalococcoidia bacterium]